MKNFILISMVSLILFGCGESDNKVLKEYLVGDWQCTMIYSIGLNVSPEEELKHTAEPEDFTIKFRILDDKLYEIKNDGTKQAIDVNGFNSTVNEICYEANCTLKQFLEIKDDDSFNNIITKRIKKLNNNTDTIDFRSKIESVCNRIK